MNILGYPGQWEKNQLRILKIYIIFLIQLLRELILYAHLVFMCSQRSGYRKHMFRNQQTVSKEITIKFIRHISNIWMIWEITNQQILQCHLNTFLNKKTKNPENQPTKQTKKK